VPRNLARSRALVGPVFHLRSRPTIAPDVRSAQNRRARPRTPLRGPSRVRARPGSPFERSPATTHPGRSARPTARTQSAALTGGPTFANHRRQHRRPFEVSRPWERERGSGDGPGTNERDVEAWSHAPASGCVSVLEGWRIHSAERGNEAPEPQAQGPERETCRWWPASPAASGKLVNPAGAVADPRPHSRPDSPNASRRSRRRLGARKRRCRVARCPGRSPRRRRPTSVQRRQERPSHRPFFSIYLSAIFGRGERNNGPP